MRSQTVGSGSSGVAVVGSSGRASCFSSPPEPGTLCERGTADGVPGEDVEPLERWIADVEAPGLAAGHAHFDRESAFRAASTLYAASHF